MSPPAEIVEPERWKRPKLDAERPDRSFGGYYRTADRKFKGKDFRGVPLQTAEDAAVAAVRMGYRVVDAQIERGLDMARRLRGAADRAGFGDTGDVLDQAENLLSRGVLLGIKWLESTANEPGNPFKRLLMAEYRMVGLLFGLTSDDAPAPDVGTARKTPDTSTEGAKPEPPAAVLKPQRQVRIRHRQDSAKRAVTIARWEMNAAPSTLPTALDLTFHFASGMTAECVTGTLTIEPKAATLEVATTDRQPSGRWRAAVCEGVEQLGILEIDL